MLLAKGCFLGSSDLSVDQPDRPQSLLGLLLASRNASTHALFLQSPLFLGGAAWKRRCRDVAPPPADVRAHHPHRRGGRPRHRGPPCATVAAACTQCTPPPPHHSPRFIKNHDLMLLGQLAWRQGACAHGTWWRAHKASLPSFPWWLALTTLIDADAADDATQAVT